MEPVVEALPESGRRAPSRRAARATGIAAGLVLVAAIVSAPLVSRSGSPTTVRSGAPAHAVFAAASATESAQSAHISVAVTAATLSFSSDGVVDLASRSADMTATLPDPWGSMEVISTGSTVFVKLPPALSGVSGGKPWIGVDLSSLGSSLGASSSSATNPFDSTAMLDWLRGVTTVQEVGTDTVRGDPTTHYSASLDPSKAMAAAPANLPDALRSRLQAGAAMLGQDLPVDVWVDAQGRVRRLRTSLDTSKVQAPGASHSAALGTVNVTVELWDFGTPVSVTPPPPDQVGSLGPLSGMLGGLLGVHGTTA